MAQQQSSRLRPLYMLTFIDWLRLHNESQPKFTPNQGGPPAGSEKPPVYIAAPQRTVSSSAREQSVSSSRTASTSQQQSQPSESSASKTATYASENSNSRSSSSNKYSPYVNASIQYNRLMHKSSNSIPIRPIPASKTVNAASPARRPTATTSPNANIVLNNQVPLTANPEFGILKTITAGKGSVSAPSVSHTPTAVTGSSNVTRPHYKEVQPISLTKTIAAQTPNAFQTLGPGFDVKDAPVKGKLGSQLSSMPSDYEHIFHAPSQINDSSTSSGKKHSRSHKKSKKK